MRCERCEVMAKIMKLLKQCESCDDNTPHGGYSHVQATDFTLTQRKADDHTPSVGVTRLNPDDEDKLRKAMTNLFALDPIELLAVQHAIHGQGGATFGDTLQQVHRRIHRYAGAIASRQMAHAMKDAIISKFPAIREVFRHAIDPSAPVDGDSCDIEDVWCDRNKGL